jgi:hypothetical protein
VQLSAVVKGSTAAAADASALDARIGAAAAELATLKTAIDREVSVVALKVSIAEVVNRVRVYVLVVPQVRLTIAAEDVLSLQPHLAELSSTLADRVTRAQSEGKDVSAAQASLDAMNAALAKAQSLAAPWPARLVTLTPAEYDSGAAAPALRQARVALGNASAQLKVAVADGRAVIAALR